jgi:hypothetical protein
MLKDPELAEIVAENKKISSRDTVMEKLYEFFSARLDAFKEDDDLQKLVVAKIREKLEESDEADQLTYAQLLKLYEIGRSLSNQQTRNVLESIKPVPNADPVLLGKPKDDESRVLTLKIDASKATAIDRIMRTLMQTPGIEGKVVDVESSES